jgi:acyl carrier protein
MGSPDVEDTVRRLLAPLTGVAPEDVDLDMPIEDAADSLELARLLGQVEKALGLTFEDRVLGRLRVVRDIVTLIDERRGRA